MNEAGFMMLRLGHDRGTTRLPWLTSRHTFSFGEYLDPAHMGYRTLRVINDDVIAPESGFGMHSHHNMEIITVVLSGELEHRDSLGHREVLRAGEVQAMSAGRGIRHSEYNPSPTSPVHMIQIWIHPQSRGTEPRYAQSSFALELRNDRWCPVVGPTRDEAQALSIDQDALLFLTRLSSQKTLEYTVHEQRSCWLHIATGSITTCGHDLQAGDALALDGAVTLTCTGVAPHSELLFDLSHDSAQQLS
jgi:redox-sensitive bicupin YhaK (pirin superfamily)